MTLPLLEFQTTARNYRVQGFEVSGDDTPRIFSTDYLSQGNDFDDLIKAAYRQIFNEQHFTKSARIQALESQLRNSQITVKDFIQGLVASNHFRTHNYDTNNNYRFVEMCFQRVLGREVESDRETLAWSVVLATKGIEGFIIDLINSDEYLNAFGNNIVPYQRRRSIAQRSIGEVSFAHMPRYDQNHLEQLKALGNDFERRYVSSSGWLPSEGTRKVGAVLTYTGAGLLSLGAIAVFLSWIGLIQL